MSFNRTKYDTCSYKQNLQNNVSTLSYILSPMYFENASKCRNQFGLIGGMPASHIKGDLVDLDSELRGQTRYISKCGSHMYLPTDDGIIKNDKTQPIDTNKMHLPSCQNVMYKSIPLPEKMDFNHC